MEEDSKLEGLLQINDEFHDYQDHFEDGVIDNENDNPTIEKVSRTTNESCSTPDSVRNNFENTQLQDSTSQSNKNYLLNFSDKNNNSMRNKIQNKQAPKNKNLNADLINSDDDDELIGYKEDLLMSDQYNTQAFNTANQSPYKDSIRSNSMGQRTSGFPMNLEETQHLRLKETLSINQNIEDYIEKELLGSDQDLDELIEQEAAFAAYNDQQLDSDILKQQPDMQQYQQQSSYPKIKEFEKSFLIKFEEFVGDNSSQLESDTNRKVSERVSDRIYETMTDQQKQQQNNQKNENDYQNYDSEEQQLQNKNKQMKSKNIKNKDHQLQKNQQTEQNSVPQHNYYGIDEDEEDNQENTIDNQTNDYGDIMAAQSAILQTQNNNNHSNNSNSNNSHSNTSINNNMSQFNSFINGNLFVIAEEESSQIYSEGVSSNYQNFNRLPSTELYNNNNQPPELLHLSTSYSKSRESVQSTTQQVCQKSKSHGYTKKKSEGIQRNVIVLDKDDRLVKTDNSPLVRRVSTNEFESHDTSCGNQMLQINNKQYDQDQLSQYFRKINNTQKQNSFVDTDEDLLSNVDKISKIVPSNEYLDYAGSHEDVIYYRTQMKTLQEQIEDMNILLYMKKQELEQIQERNERLEENVRQLQQNQDKKILKGGVDYQTQTISMFHHHSRKDSFTQTDHKIRAKEQNQNSKKSPSRIGQNRTNVSQDYSNDNIPLPMVNNPRKQSLKQSPSNQNAITYSQSPYQNVSFTSDDMKSFQQQQSLIMQLKNQLQKADSENLGLLEKSNNIESKHIELEQYLMKIEKEKQDMLNRLNQMQAKCQDKERNVEGLSAENIELKRSLDHITSQNSPLKKIERNLSAIHLIQVVQSETQTPPIGQKLDDSFHFEYEHEHFSTYSSKDDIEVQQQPTVQQQDLDMLMSKAKDYEQLSHQLQSEIQNHRKSLKENQDKFLVKNLQLYKEEAKRKIKKRESKIERLELIIKEKDKVNEDLKKKAEDLMEKIQSLKMKMESRVQEKEFKILTLKNQLKHCANSGFITPVSNGAPPANISFTTQKDMLTMINEIIKQQLLQQQEIKNKVNNNEQLSFNENSPNNNNNNNNNNINLPITSKVDPYQYSTKQRAKSYENSQYISKKDDLLYKQGMSGGGVGCGFGFESNTPSIGGGGQGGQHYWKDNEYINQIIQRSNDMDSDIPAHERRTFMSKGSSNTRYRTPNECQQNISFEIQKETSQPLKQIFNSSLKRINKELESIKELNSQAKSQSQNTNDVFRYQQNNKEVKQKQQNQVNQGNLTFEDSLQDYIKNEGDEYMSQNNKQQVKDQDDDDCQSSYISNQFDDRFKQLLINQAKQNRLSQKKTVTDNAQGIDYQGCYLKNIEEDNKNKGDKFLPTFQRPSSFKQTNYPNNNNLFLLDQSQPNFGQTLNFDGKEQNESIFYDLKPQFDNSNYSSSSITENNISTHKNSKPFIYQPPQFELQKYYQYKAPQYSSAIRGGYVFNELQFLFSGMNQDFTDNNQAKEIYPRSHQKLKKTDMMPSSLKITQMGHFNSGLNFEEEEDKQLSARRKVNSYGGNSLRDTCAINKLPYSNQGGQPNLGSGIKPISDNPHIHQQLQQYHKQTNASQYNSIRNQKQFVNSQMQLNNQSTKGQTNGASGMQINISNYVSSSCSSSQRLEDLKKKYGRIDNNQ